MKSNKDIKMILRELSTLRSQGLLDEESYLSCVEYYKSANGTAKSPVLKYAYTAVMIIGGLMLALGVITFFSYNWNSLGRSLQVAISFIPLLLAGAFSVFVIRNKEGRALDEISAVTTFAGIIVLITMLTHIYQISGNIVDFFTLLIVLGVPLMYVFDSYLLFACISLMLLAFGYPELTIGYEFIRNLLFAALIFPFMSAKLKKKGFARAIIQYFAIPYLLFIAFTFSGFKQIPAVLFSMIGFILVMSLNENRAGVSILTSPWYALSYLALSGILVFASLYRVPGLDIGSRFKAAPFANSIPVVFMLLMIAGSFYMAFRNNKAGKNASFMTDFMIALYQVLVLHIHLSESGQTRLTTNILTLAIVYCFIKEGIKLKRLLIVNLGIIMFLEYLFAYFATASFSQLDKSFLFMTGGVIFLVFNHIAYKRMKDSPDESSAEALTMKGAES
ncbi:MAG: DUF2157 domain-containing protein [Candidatus Riflebacteria bacterium]|nr:DUF2157 domain-containing protein [Candidatus Riflebacteria bacterium]